MKKHRFNKELLKIMTAERSLKAQSGVNAGCNFARFGGTDT